MFSALLGSDARRRDLMSRFEKLKNDEFIWWMTTIERMLPLAKERLTILAEVATTLARSGDLGAVRLTEIESDARWITKKKNMIIHDMKVYDEAIKDTTRRPQDREKRGLPTVGKENGNKKRKLIALGMRGLLGT